MLELSRSLTESVLPTTPRRVIGGISYRSASSSACSGSVCRPSPARFRPRSWLNSRSLGSGSRNEQHGLFVVGGPKAHQLVPTPSAGRHAGPGKESRSSGNRSVTSKSRIFSASRASVFYLRTIESVFTEHSFEPWCVARGLHPNAGWIRSRTLR